MKNKILTVIIIFLTVLTVMSVIFFVITKSNNNKPTQTIETTEAFTDSVTATGLTTDINEYKINQLKMELEKYQSANNDTEQEIIKKAAKYINIRYNYSGLASDNKDSIVDEVKPYVAEGYLRQIENSIDSPKGNFTNIISDKKTDDYCNASDIYITSDTYADGSKLYMTACVVKVKEDLIRYHQISFAQYDNGEYLINYDNTLNINYANYVLKEYTQPVTEEKGDSKNEKAAE